MKALFFAGIAFLMAAGPSMGARTIYSRADLLAGTALECFDSFDGIRTLWRGAGEALGGELRIVAPEGEWAAAWIPCGELSRVTVVEWEGARRAGPPESGWAFLLGAGTVENGGVRVLFSGGMMVRVERFGAAGTEILAGPVSPPGLFLSGWNRAAVRIEKGRITVVIAGEEALAAPLPDSTWSAIGLAAGPGSAFVFDNIALHTTGAARSQSPRAPSVRALLFDGFGSDRGLWARGAFPVLRGALTITTPNRAPLFDLLASPPRGAERIETLFAIDGPGPADFLLGARAEGDDFRGLIFRVMPSGEVFLLERSGGTDRPVRSLSGLIVDLRHGWNRLAARLENGEADIHLNGRPVMRVAMPDGLRGFGVRAEPGAAFALDDLLVFGESAGDTARARSAWRAARFLDGSAGADEGATRVERIRETALALPGLPGVLDLLFREAVLAGDVETALAAAAASLEERPGVTEKEQTWALALLLAGRLEEARGALARFRALFPEDPFGLENTLLLLDRNGERERLVREYRAARVGVEPLRAAAHGVAAWAYLRDRLTAEAAEALAEALRLGPGRLDLEIVEADLLRARGDARAALARYASFLERELPPEVEGAVHARLALTCFESGDFERAARELATLETAEDERAERARRILRSVALVRTGETVEGEAGRAALLEGRALAESTLADPPGTEDAILFDLLGRVESALALLDFQSDGDYRAYREHGRRADRLHARSAALDPRFASPPGAAGEVGTRPAPDPGRYAALVAAALPDDHPVGGFTEDPQRWASWRAVDRRADLAERAIEEILGQ
ncbi:MAG: hypothetical protein JW958_13010 [Candidatus Eisenbacteria bacterium]|nr:hypothetical protein [Candidatus Eisenbacteria bacterium]